MLYKVYFLHRQILPCLQDSSQLLVLHITILIPSAQFRIWCIGIFYSNILNSQSLYYSKREREQERTKSKYVSLHYYYYYYYFNVLIKSNIYVSLQKLQKLSISKTALNHSIMIFTCWCKKCVFKFGH